MRILSIDSSAFPASAAVVEDGKITAEFFINTKLTHSQTLMPMIKSVLDMSQTKIEDIDLVAVTVGPGSFTGVRIGVASAKGIAMPTNITCCGISSLEALAYNFYNSTEDMVICACMDARCGQVYNAIFEIHDGKVKRLTEDRTILISELLCETENFENSIHLAGDGAELCFKSFSEFGAILVPENLRYQRASSVAFCAQVHNSSGDAVTSAELQPLYLQLPQAQRELNSRRNKND